MPETLRCTRCGSVNDVGVCWVFNADYPEPSGEAHDMRPYVVASTVMTLDDVIALNHQLEHENDVWGEV